MTGCLLEAEGVLRHGWDGSTVEDSDGDGIPDDLPDNCPDVPNRSQSDFDDDGLGNACDTDASGQDADGDTIDDRLDMCFGERSGTNEDGDTYPAVMWQIVDDCDSCPAVPNPEQRNADGDDIGDVCEAPGEPDLLANITFFDRLRDDLMGWRILDYSAWSFVSGELVAEPTGIEHAVVPDAIAARTGSVFAIETDLWMDEPSVPGSLFAGLLVATELDSSRTGLVAWHACVLEWDSTADPTLRIQLRFKEPGCTTGPCTMGEVLADEPAGIVWETGTTYRLYALREGNRIACYVGPSQSEILGSVTATVASLAGGGPGLTAASSRAGFERATVYTP
jgi:hypothetical protein